MQTLGENELEGENPELEDSEGNTLDICIKMVSDDTVLVTVATEKAASAPATSKQTIPELSI